MTTEKAIRLIDEYIEEPNSIHPDWLEILKLCRELLSKKQEESKVAEWRINSDGWYPYCSHCGEEPPGSVMKDYCPNCGYKMKKGF